MELTTSALLLAMLGLALADSINPSALVMTGYILVKAPERAKKRAVLSYVAGIFCLYFVIGALFTLGVGLLREIVGGVWGMRLLMGLQAVIGAGMLWWAIAQPKFSSRPQRFAVTVFSPKVLFPLGMMITLVELVTALPYVAAIGLLQQADMSLAVKLGILFVYTIIFVLPPLLMLVLYRKNQARITAWLERRRAKQAAQKSDTMQWIVGVIGVMLLINAVSALA